MSARAPVVFECVDLKTRLGTRITGSHFFTVERPSFERWIFFWAKPHWYSRRRLVGFLHGDFWLVRPQLAP